MNRIEIYYKKEPTRIEDGKMIASKLEIRNDIKGYTNVPLMVLYGKEADLVFNLLKYIDWDKAKKDDFMKYDEREAVITELDSEDYKKFYELLYGSYDEYQSW